jgi:hypothetical protein
LEVVVARVRATVPVEVTA